jgi:hypothetical protein
MIRSGGARQGSHLASENGNKPSLPAYVIHYIVEVQARKNRMRILPYVIVAAGIGGAALTASSSGASPLSSGLAQSDSMLPEISTGMVQKVHNWHCRKKKGWYRGSKRWHRHAGGCRQSRYPYSAYRHYPHIYSSPAPGFYFDEWGWERRNWLWD